MLEEEGINSDNLDIPLDYKKEIYTNKNKRIIISLVILNIILIGLSSYILIVYFKNSNNFNDKDKNDKKEEEIKEEKNFTIIKYDKDIPKPKIKLNFEFELIKMKNGMKGLLINDPYANIFHFQFQIENGQLMDTINGLAHLDEHMICSGSEKNEYYSLIRKVFGIQGFNLNAYTDQLSQVYSASILYNFKYDKIIDLFVDAFRYPSFDEKIIEKEIQTINSEFYLNYRARYYLLPHIIRQLSSNKTSYNGFGIGNNETLKPSESLKISRKLKGYHMVSNRPENIFFVLYSNLSINHLEKYVDNNFNYKMHEFKDDEIDLDDKKQLEENIKKLKKEEIFDENLYEHGIYYNSNINQNILNIFLHIGNVDYKDLQFDIIEYYDYLLNSKSLLKILKEKDYIPDLNKIGVFTYLLLENNNVIILEIVLTDKGFKEVENVLLIIYKYIEIMKTEGYKKIYFDNFINYKQSLMINSFERSKLISDIANTFTQFIQNYHIYGDNQILTTGTPSEKNYDENKLKAYLNNLKYEKSFFAVNAISNLTKLNSENIFLESPIKKTLKYYNSDFLYGKIRNELKEKINYIKIDNLSIREINPYFSEKYEKDTPCYKKTPNNCKELNEFDIENEEEYNETLFEEKDNYITYYQIDKSSEAFIVNSYFEIKCITNELFNDAILIKIEYNYLNQKFNEINEIETISLAIFYNMTIGFIIKSFSDNTEKIFKDFIQYLKEEPKEEEFKYSIDLVKSEFNNNNEQTLRDYTFSIGQTFLNKGETYDMNIEETINKINNITFDDFKDMHNNIFNNIISSTLKITGNIDINLVKDLHKLMKDNINIKDIEPNLKNSKITRLSSDNSYVINYYQKSKLVNEVDNSILVIYKYDDKYKQYMSVLYGCLNNIGLITLRFNYSNAYSPSFMIIPNYIYIFEQGRYKQVTQMEDDINEVLLKIINGNIQCENYHDIIESFKLKGSENKEKTYNTLFNDYIYGKYEPYIIDFDETIYPDSFEELMQELSPIFINPQRITILIGRNDLSNEDFQKLVKNREEAAEYILNKEISIEHTQKIDYLKDKII